MGFLSNVFGSKPEVPELKELNLSDEQMLAIANNLKAAPDAARLANLTADQIDALLRRTMPNADQIFGGVSENIASMVAGEVPKDVQDFIMRSNAARALEGGYAGMGMHGALTARDLGLSSLDLTLKGQSAAESWMGASERLYAPAMATYTNMFITPMQQAAFDVEERNTQFQRQWLKSQISAMPDPVLRGLHDTIMSLAVAYLGGQYTPDNPQANYANAGRGVGGNSDWGSSWGSGNTSFGAPITSPGMSYDVGGGGAAPAGGSGFGAPISSPGMSLGGI